MIQTKSHFFSHNSSSFPLGYQESCNLRTWKTTINRLFGSSVISFVFKATIFRTSHSTTPSGAPHTPLNARKKNAGTSTSVSAVTSPTQVTSTPTIPAH
ncbi:hypothetical protein L2E82_47850 [Cichorium intybus]|uniref:Uncharacterized protein n=1 Tax=Cichorium intybus TaxID=13427 RepID=A0ACB8YXW3_CICIN|nr:hypothetical protein L2E82_47850 [Cichorium intybus]